MSEALQPGSRRSFGIVEWLLVVGGVAIVAAAAGWYRGQQSMEPFVSFDPEMRHLERTYGPSRHSEHGEEWILRDVFGPTRDGVFVDVGANDYKIFSNTYYLETELGWSGLAVEPQTKFAGDYATFRPRTTFVPLFVADVSDAETVLFVPPNDLAASNSKAFAEAEGTATPSRVRTSTLDDILGRAAITHIDFLTMDIELAEPAALKGFSIARYPPRLVCIEAHPEVRQFILNYFARAGYVIVGKYLRADSQNLWFAPLSNETP